MGPDYWLRRYPKPRAGMTIERTAAAWGEPQIAEPHVLHHRP